MFLADFHMHTNQSDGKIPMRELVDMHGKRGFGAIAITDHLCEQVSLLGRASRYLGLSLSDAQFVSYMDQIEEEADRAWKLYRMVVLPGFEITKNALNNHRSAHMLGIGTRKFVNPNLDFPELCRLIREDGGLTVAAHPVSTRKWEKQTYELWDRREELRSGFDAWEVASGPYLFDEVKQSGLPLIASSDMHVPRQMRSWKTVLTCERHPEAILDAIRRQDLSFRFYEDPVTAAIPRAAAPCLAPMRLPAASRISL